jgi:hypothetical protein
VAFAGVRGWGSTPGEETMIRFLPWARNRVAPVVGALVLAGYFAGCSIGPEHAKAGQRKRIETFAVLATSVLLLADTAPTVEATEGSTKYTLQSAGSINFRLETGADQSFALEAGEVVIERPGAGLLTIMRSQ